ncbi:MAG TPA: MFS transporter [Dehalococcoidia bacterium]|nr:MFS transporter [Dehalococcoidia bacterium]
MDNLYGLLNDFLCNDFPDRAGLCQGRAGSERGEVWLDVGSTGDRAGGEGICNAARGGFRRKSYGVTAGAIVFGLGLAGFGLSDTYWLSLVFLFVAGIGFPLWVTPVVTLLQDHSVPEYRGRVMAVYTIPLQGVSIGWMLGGVLMDLIGNYPTVLVSVFGGWVVGGVALVASRDFRRA